MIRRRPIFALFAALAGGVSTAQADVTIDFSATLSAGVDEGLATITSLDGFNAGDTVTGSITFDPMVAASQTTSYYAIYPFAGATLTDGGTTTTFDNPDLNQFDVDYSSGIYEVQLYAYTADASYNLVFTLDPTAFVGNGLAFPSISTSSFAATAAIIGNGGLSPDLPLTLTPADSGSPVPEPASILAFATGLLGVAFVRRRHA